MASPSSTSWLLRPLTVLALTAATLVALPAIGHAVPPAPTTTADARAQLGALSSQAEIVAEQYNNARVVLARRLHTYQAADKQARAIQVQYAALAGQIKHVVSGVYKTVPFSQFTLMLTSTSPRQFMDQMSALNLIAGRRSALINKIAGVRTAALKAQASAQSALAAAQKVERDIAAKKADLAKRKVVLQTVLSRLSLADRYAVGDPTGRGSRSDSRTPVNVGPASPAALKAVQTALSKRGDPYSWGAAGPSAFDCSGLTMYAWAASGVGLPHSSSAQYGVGTHVSRGEVRAGDLVFFYSPTIHHVGLAINNTQMVHASTYGVPVQVANIDSFPYVGAARVG